MFKLFRKKVKDWPIEYQRLAQYNAEVYRGIVHTKECDEYMKTIQEKYDREYLKIK